MNNKDENKKGAKWKPLFIFIVICVMAGLVINAFHSGLQTEIPKAPTKAEPTYTPKTVPKPSYSKPTTPKPKPSYASPSTTTQTVSVSSDLKKQFSAWDGSHRKTVKYIKNRMKNPKSFKHVKTTYTPHKDPNYRVIVMKYRGTNSFNAVVTHTALVKVKKNGDVVEIITQL